MSLKSLLFILQLKFVWCNTKSCQIPRNRCRVPNISVGTIIFRGSRPEVFCKKDILKNFAKFTGKHLCKSLFFNKVVG